MGMFKNESSFSSCLLNFIFIKKICVHYLKSGGIERPLTTQIFAPQKIPEHIINHMLSEPIEKIMWLPGVTVNALTKHMSEPIGLC